MADIIVIVAIAIAIFLAIVFMVKNKNKGCSGCEGCSMGCDRNYRNCYKNSSLEEINNINHDKNSDV